MLCSTVYFQVVGQNLAKYPTLKNVLQNNKVGKENIFFDSFEGIETHFIYIGNLKSSAGRTYKIITSYYVRKSSGHTRGCIYVFGQSNNYLGSYKNFLMTELPVKILNNSLYFDKNRSGCTLADAVNFNNGIPKILYVKCSDPEEGIGHSFYPNE